MSVGTSSAGGEVIASAIRWEDVQQELKGKTTFTQPVVTQEVLLESLRASAFQLQTVTADHEVTKRTNAKTLFLYVAVTHHGVGYFHKTCNI